jgi:hypothetical protein
MAATYKLERTARGLHAVTDVNAKLSRFKRRAPVAAATAVVPVPVTVAKRDAKQQMIIDLDALVSHLLEHKPLDKAALHRELHQPDLHLYCSKLTAAKRRHFDAMVSLGRQHVLTVATFFTCSTAAADLLTVSFIR